MKKRLGFVSNSSSSSFVVMGVKITRDEEVEIAKKFKDIDNDESVYLPDIVSGIGNNYLDDDDATYLGTIICNVHDDDGGLEQNEIDMEDMIKRTKNVLEKVGLQDRNIKIYTGTRSC